jgi:hypothetical protein
MHTTVKKFLNSLVPPFVDPAYVPKDVDKNWSCYKHARPQRATWENENRGTPPISHVYHVCTRQCNIYIYINIHALSLAGLGVHGLSLSGPMNATFWLKWELAQNSIHCFYFSNLGWPGGLWPAVDTGLGLRTCHTVTDPRQTRGQRVKTKLTWQRREKERGGV